MDAPLPEAVREGVHLFNAGAYFEAHEAWEDHWGLGGAAERGLTLGLIKAAVALHHLEGGNAAGFAWQAERAIRELRANAHVWPVLEVGLLADRLEGLAAECRFAGKVPASWARPELPLV